MRTRQQCIAEAIAARIIRNKTRKRFSALHADAIGEIMSTPTSSTLNGGTSRVEIGRPQNVEALGQRPLAGRSGEDSIRSGMAVGSDVAVTVKPVGRKTIEGSTPGDHRSPNTGGSTTDSFKNQAGPRGETTHDWNAGA